MIEFEYIENRTKPLEDEIMGVLMESLSINSEQSKAVNTVYNELYKEVEELLKDEPLSISDMGVETYGVSFENWFEYMGNPLTINVYIYNFPNNITFKRFSNLYQIKNGYDRDTGEITISLKTVNKVIDRIKLKSNLSHELFHGFQIPKTSMDNTTSNRSVYRRAAAVGIPNAKNREEHAIFYALYSSFKTERDAFLNQMYNDLMSLPQDTPPKEYWRKIETTKVGSIIKSYDEINSLKNDNEFINILKKCLSVFSSEKPTNIPEIDKLPKRVVTIENFYKRINEARKYYIEKIGHIIAYIIEERGYKLENFARKNIDY